MSGFSISSIKQSRQVPVAAAASVFIAFWLFFIDEGYYDLRWMQDGGNWLMFTAFIMPAFLAQLLISDFVFRKITGIKHSMLMILTGVPLGLITFILLIFSIGAPVTVLLFLVLLTVYLYRFH